MESVRLPAGFAPVAECLRDRVVLVVGAAGGLGSATALAAARAGATVVLLGRRVPALERLYDEIVKVGAPTPAIYPLDLEGATPADYEQLAQTIARECGRLDAVVIASARFSGLAQFTALAPEDWVRDLHVNVSAPWLLIQACLSLLAQRDRANVIVLLDDPARVGKAYWGAYGIAKQALSGMLALLADELENSPIAVHGVMPGPMRTALRKKAYMAEDQSQLAAPETVADALLYLLSDSTDAARGRILDLRGPG